MRDIIRLFADTESRDVLGLGQVRDAVGDALFPGSSTLHTRARYLLFVPWIFKAATERNRSLEWVETEERRLIKAIRDSDNYEGLLGMHAGASLKTLPSTIYWAMLGTHGILRDANMSRTEALSTPRQSVEAWGDDAPAATNSWSTTIPAPPPGFPHEVPGGFALTYEEAAWLRERFLSGGQDTLLAHFLLNPPGEESRAPWEDPAVVGVTGAAAGWLEHARSFSSVIHGAQLLYNLLLAEEHERCGIGADLKAPHAERYQTELEEWHERLPGLVDVAGWDVREFLNRVAVHRGAPIHPRNRAFITAWADYVREHDGANPAYDADARGFIARRERQHKGANARLGNPKRLQHWGGGSGAGSLKFRWSNVRRILTDVHTGLASEATLALPDGVIERETEHMIDRRGVTADA